MKLSAKLTCTCLAVLAIALGILTSAIVGITFSDQLSQAAHTLESRGGDARKAIEAAAANYALQGIELTDNMVCDIIEQLDCAPSEDIGEDCIVLNGSTMSLSMNVTLSGRAYSFIINQSIADVLEARRKMLLNYAVLYISVMLICAAALKAIAHELTGPIEQLAETCAKIAHGDYTIRAQPSEGETGVLAQAFNSMTDALTGQMERRDRFISALSHEIKTPLTAIMGHAELIRSGRMADYENMQAAQYIFKEGRRLSDMSEKLMKLILLNEDAIDTKIISADWLVENVCQIVDLRAKECGVPLKCHTEPHFVRGDDALLSTLLNNLIDNALKSGGTNVQVAEMRRNNRICISVTDNGRGMPPEELTRITEPFYRVDKSRSRDQGGAGLGLALCAEIAKAHNGELRFESTPGRGTCAMLLLDEVNTDD